MRKPNVSPSGQRPNKPDNRPSRMYQDDEQRNKHAGNSEFDQTSSESKIDEQGTRTQTRLDRRRSTDPSRQPLYGDPMAEETEMDNALNRSWEDEE